MWCVTTTSAPVFNHGEDDSSTSEKDLQNLSRIIEKRKVLQHTPYEIYKMTREEAIKMVIESNRDSGILRCNNHVLELKKYKNSGKKKTNVGETRKSRN